MTTAPTSFDHLFKIVLVGDSGVGKSNLLSRFTKDNFTTDEKSTIGVEFATRIVPMSDGKNVKMQVWDTAGQERYRAITNAYYRGALGALLVYDITSQTSFHNISRWLHELRDHANRDVVLAVVGNKKDLCDQPGMRAVTEEQAQALAAEINIPVIETSAKSGEGVEESFISVAKRIYEAAFMNKNQPEKTDLGTVEVNTNNEPKKKSGCCG
jgi:small GTP-binding protein